MLATVRFKMVGTRTSAVSNNSTTEDMPAARASSIATSLSAPADSSTCAHSVSSFSAATKIGVPPSCTQPTYVLSYTLHVTVQHHVHNSMLLTPRCAATTNRTAPCTLSHRFVHIATEPCQHLNTLLVPILCCNKHRCAPILDATHAHGHPTSTPTSTPYADPSTLTVLALFTSPPRLANTSIHSERACCAAM